jgi:hypothetical protein
VRVRAQTSYRRGYVSKTSPNWGVLGPKMPRKMAAQNRLDYPQNGH